MAYVKMISEKEYTYAPKNFGSILNFNSNEELMKEHGYKLFVPCEEKIDNDRRYELNYIEEDECIKEIVKYTETEEEYSKRRYYERKAEFEKSFIYIPEVTYNSKIIFKGGYYRKIPKGYSSAIESIIAVSKVVEIEKKLPSRILSFYEKPNFYEDDSLNENVIAEGQFYIDEMSIEEFNLFYITFVQTWNEKNHL